ncbi:MAG: hypothetical protein EP344_19435 [Bacteroidetes bacterium]|nr:MAG: hypothetical protein EP344_19435 [Bacteroidota bacterium]
MTIDQVKHIIGQPLTSCNDPGDPKEWMRLALHITGHLLPKIRSERLGVGAMLANYKEDGSPFTRFEESIEAYCKEVLAGFYPEAGFIGEESGLSNGDGRVLFVIDPIDGTRSFLSGFDSFAMTIAIVKDKFPLVSMVSNPATGDIAFRMGNATSQVISMPVHGQEWQMKSLPLLPPRSDSPILVNLHPATTSKVYIDKLYALWQEKRVAMVKSVSGSPSWQIIEASKGDVLYINTWQTTVTMPFDLVAALHILEGAGGQCLNHQGQKVNPWDHAGIFFAGINAAHLESVKQALEQ